MVRWYNAMSHFFKDQRVGPARPGNVKDEPSALLASLGAPAWRCELALDASRWTPRMIPQSPRRNRPARAPRRPPRPRARRRRAAPAPFEPRDLSPPLSRATPLFVILPARTGMLRRTSRGGLCGGCVCGGAVGARSVVFFSQKKANVANNLFSRRHPSTAPPGHN